MTNIKKHKVTLRFGNKDFIEKLEELLVSTGAVKVTGLGIFEIKQFQAKPFYNIYKDKMDTLPAMNKLVFRPTKQLKLAIQKYGKA